MRIACRLVASCAFACCFATAQADLVPPKATEARERLRANPDIYDRVDNFCAGKRPGADCRISGSSFAGGGEGICVNEINEKEWTIDMSCERRTHVVIERKLPPGGFIVDAHLCKSGVDSQTSRRLNCKPATAMPVDRFCKRKQLGRSCSVQLTSDGKKEEHAGICKKVTETEEFYYEGRRLATRDVIRCEPPETIQRTYTRVSWPQKIFQ